MDTHTIRLTPVTGPDFIYILTTLTFFFFNPLNQSLLLVKLGLEFKRAPDPWAVLDRATQRRPEERYLYEQRSTALKLILKKKYIIKKKKGLRYQRIM